MTNNQYYTEKNFTLSFENGINSQVFPTIGYDSYGIKQMSFLYIPLSSLENIVEIEQATISMEVQTYPETDFYWGLDRLTGEEIVQYYSGDVNARIVFDVTEALKATIERGAAEFQVMIKPIPEAMSETWLKFKNNATLTIREIVSGTYVNNQEIVTDNNDYINVCSGEMRYIEPVAVSTGKETPYSLSYYYDQKQKVWRNNFQQTVEMISGLRAMYTDGNGYTHTFLRGSVNENFKDDQGLEMTLQTDLYGVGAPTAIYSLNGDALYFDEAGLLCEMTNVYGKNINISYGTNGQMEIIDSNGHAMKIVFDAAEDGLPYSVTDEAGRVTLFQCSGGKIRRITYPDSTITSIGYNTDGLIDRITSRDSITTEYVYDEDEPDRVVSVVKYGADKTFANPDEYVNFEYREDDNNGCKATVIKNRTGINTVYVFDADKRPIMKYEEKTLDGTTDRTNVTGTAIYAYTGTKRTFAATLNVDDDAHNLITNGSFESSSALNSFNITGSASVVNNTSTDGVSALRITSAGGEVKQTVRVTADDIKYGNTLIASAWAKFDNNAKTVSLSASVCDKDGVESEIAPSKFNSSYSGWGYVAIPITIDKSKLPCDVTVCISVSSSSNVCYIDNIRLSNALAKSVEYRQYGNIIGQDENGDDIIERHFETIFGTEQYIDEIVTTTDGIYTTKEYRDKKNNVLMKTVEDLDGNIFKSVYKYDSEHRLIYSQDYKNMITAYEYNDSFIERTKSFKYSSFNPANIDTVCAAQAKTLVHSRTHTGEGEEYVWEEHDERSEDMKSVNEYGKVCTDILGKDKAATRGLVTKTTSPLGLETVYTYADTDDKVTGISAQDGNNVYSVMYGYDAKRRLSRITHNGFNYLFDYDGMGRMKTVTVGDTVYSTNTYDTSGATTTVSTTYAGGEKLTVTTDRHQNPVKKTYTNAAGTTSELAEAEYDELGKVTKYIDKTTGQCR